ncbi:SulP family inorganic anion transporter [Marinicrinis sediminis]|uniref:SulP family inorganic anion transporter n=1 Tax=Marinicrinis sediminis TaxID=1652465 RepID=A0ABW5RFR8_9BACL
MSGLWPYTRTNLRGDLTAGMVVAVILIPQALAYAMLAGLPPIYGLYASTIPLVLYALFGSSRQLSVGPAATVSLLVFSSLAPLATPESPSYLALAVLLTFLIGASQLLMGLLRFGFIATFLSHGVIRAFTAAAAILIILSQLKHILGIALTSGGSFLSTMGQLMQQWQDIHGLTLLFGAASMLLLIAVKKWRFPVPGPLLLIPLATLLTYLFRLDQKGLGIAGPVASGFPSVRLPMLQHDMDTYTSLIPLALTIALVSFVESTSIARSLATSSRDQSRPNRDLIGLGLANLSSSLVSALPVTGGLSRSAMNRQSGAQTQLASIITAVLISATLLFFTSAFYYLPMSALAAMIIVGVAPLIEFRTPSSYFRIKKSDGWVWVVAFAGTLLLGVMKGILLGVVFSLMLFIKRSAYPHTAELGYLPQKQLYRNVLRYPEAKTMPGVLIFRMDASFYFANMGYLEKQLHERLEMRRDIRWIILDGSSANAIDAVALSSLLQFRHELQEGGVTLLFAQLKGPVKDLFQRSDWSQYSFHSYAFDTIDEALAVIRRDP